MRGLTNGLQVTGFEKLCAVVTCVVQPVLILNKEKIENQSVNKVNGFCEKSKVQQMKHLHTLHTL